MKSLVIFNLDCFRRMPLEIFLTLERIIFCSHFVNWQRSFEAAMSLRNVVLSTPVFGEQSRKGTVTSFV